jgi:hypothetical protein
MACEQARFARLTETRLQSKRLPQRAKKQNENPYDRSGIERDLSSD